MKNGELKIEKGVPIPAGGTRGGRKGFAAVLRLLKVGDSVVLPTVHGSRAGQNVLGTGNYASCREGKGTRVWRLK